MMLSTPKAYNSEMKAARDVFDRTPRRSVVLDVTGEPYEMRPRRIGFDLTIKV